MVSEIGLVACHWRRPGALMRVLAFLAGLLVGAVAVIVWSPGCNDDGRDPNCQPTAPPQDGRYSSSAGPHCDASAKPACTPDDEIVISDGGTVLVETFVEGSSHIHVTYMAPK
jgi:hypothetical protein